MHQVSNYEEHSCRYSCYDIYVSSAKLYSVGMEAYSNSMSVRVFHRDNGYQINYIEPALLTALDLWWRTFKNTIPLEPYLREVLG